MQTSLPYFLLVIQAIGPTAVAVVVGSIAGYVAYRQWRTANNRLKFDLYEKRYAVYQATKLLIEKIAIHGQTLPGDIGEFHQAIRGSEFLFEGKTRAYLMKLSDLAFKAHLARRRQSRVSDQSKLEKLVDEEEEILNFLQSQDAELEKIFGRYLDLSRVGL